MKKRFIVMSQAHRDVMSQAEYYSQHSGDQLASRFFDTAEAAYRFLLRHPSLGKPCRILRHREQGVREFGISGFSRHLVIYRAIPEGIEVIRVIHASRDLDTLLETSL